MKIPEQNDFEKIVYKKRGEKKHVFLKKLLEEMQWHLRCFRFLKPAELPIYCCTADYRRLPIGCRPQIPVAYILKIHISSTVTAVPGYGLRTVDSTGSYASTLCMGMPV